MKRSLYITMFTIIFLVSACSGSQTIATEANSTNTPEPPTATLPPTKTPTATPDSTATIMAQSTQEAEEVITEVDKLLSDTDISYKNGHLAWQQSESIAINMTGPSRSATIKEIDQNVKADNFIFKSDVTWEASGWMFCGSIFRSESNIKTGKQYQFYFLRLSGLPIWYIDVFEHGMFKSTISKEQKSREIDMDNGAVNQFVLVAEDEKFTVYFNGIRQGRFFDNSKQREEGSFGFFAWQESGSGSCKFENSWVWALDK